VSRPVAKPEKPHRVFFFFYLSSRQPVSTPKPILGFHFARHTITWCRFFALWKKTTFTPSFDSLGVALACFSACCCPNFRPFVELPIPLFLCPLFSFPLCVYVSPTKPSPSYFVAAARGVPRVCSSGSGAAVFFFLARPTCPSTIGGGPPHSFDFFLSRVYLEVCFQTFLALGLYFFPNSSFFACFHREHPMRFYILFPGPQPAPLHHTVFLSLPPVSVSSPTVQCPPRHPFLLPFFQFVFPGTASSL